MSSVQAVDLARQFKADGISAIVYTDIARDGMMQGVNVEATAKLARDSGLPIIAANTMAEAATAIVAAVK